MKKKVVQNSLSSKQTNFRKKIIRNHAHHQIHKILRKHHPEAVKKSEKLFLFGYPKLIILSIAIISAYILFSKSFFYEISVMLNGLNYFGVFLSGALTAFGFTAPFGIGMLISLSSKNIWVGTLIGGLGATMVDLIIFKTIRFSFMNEFKKLEKTKVIKKIEKIVKGNKHVLLKHYLLYIFAGIILATPLPDELGISMLAGLTTIKPMRLALVCFLLHSTFIFLMLLI